LTVTEKLRANCLKHATCDCNAFQRLALCICKDLQPQVSQAFVCPNSHSGRAATQSCQQRSCSDYVAMPSFDEYLDEFFSTPRTLEAQLLAPNAEAILAICDQPIPALDSLKNLAGSSKWPRCAQKIISQFYGNTPAGVPLWAVAKRPEFFKNIRRHLRKHMWTESWEPGGHGSGRSRVYKLQFVNLNRLVWQHVIDNRLVVKHEPPPSKFPRPSHSLAESRVTEVNSGGTAVRKADGYWMHIGRARAVPALEYTLVTEPNYN